MEYVKNPKLWEDFLLSEGYELQGQLDSGGFSDVFAVTSVRTGRAMAVKRIVARRAIMDDPRLKTEISCLSKLRGVRGSCVIWLEEVVVRESLACLVLELAPLGDLERYASLHWPLSPGLVRCCVRQVSTALTHCHRLQVAHRDLHPANVLLLSPRRVRLGDFGLAVTCSQRPPLCRDYVGREAYLAPEVLAQRPYDAVRADLWSLGALSSFLSTGRHPHPAVSCPVCVHPHPAVSCPVCGHPPVGSLMSVCEIDRCVLPEYPLMSPLSNDDKDQCIPTTGQLPDAAMPCSTCQDISGNPLGSAVSQKDQSIPNTGQQHNPAYHCNDCEQTSESLLVSENDQLTPDGEKLTSHPDTDVHKSNSCRSVKEFLPGPPRSKRYRASSCDSEGSGHSESDTERLSSPHHSIMSDDSPESSCESSSQSHSVKRRCHCECHEGDPVRMTVMAAKMEASREMMEIKRALMEFVSKLCVHDPSGRMSAEDTLEWWKQRMAKSGKS